MQDSSGKFFDRNIQSIIMQSLSLLMCCILTISIKTWAADSSSLEISPDHKTISSPATEIKSKTKNKKSIRIAIIIDDLGYNLKHGKVAANLPGAVTLSVLPHSPHGKSIAKLGIKQQKEIMLHAPMSSVLDKPLDEGGLTPNMPREDFVASLKSSLAELPRVQGVNNHMGSELTQQRQPMAWLMEELLGEGLYFVDSRTISTSLAWETALDFGVPATRRDIFLDNDPSYPAIAQQFGSLLSLAKKRGHAIAIAHPYPETLRFLQSALPMLSQANIHLVPVSELLSVNGIKRSNKRISNQRVVDRPHEVVGLINYLSE